MERERKYTGIYGEIAEQRWNERWQQQGISVCIRLQYRDSRIAAVIFEPGNLTRYEVLMTKIPDGARFAKPHQEGISVVGYFSQHMATITNMPDKRPIRFSSYLSPDDVHLAMGLGEVDALVVFELLMHLIETWPN